LIGDEAEPEPRADSLTLVGEVGVPALAPERFVAGFMCAFILPYRLQGLRRARLRQRRQRVDVEHMLAVARQHGHEHRVAALGALQQYRRDDRHHHPEKALPA
jgi:hypothetical protein